MKISRKTTDRIISRMVELFCRTARLTPPSIGLPMGRMLGYLLCWADPHHRNIAHANLKFAYQSTKNDQQIKRLVYQNFMQWGMIAYEWGRNRFYHHLCPHQAPNFIGITGITHLEKAKQKSNTVILLSAHFGNWEYGHQYYGRMINKLSFIVRRIDNPYIEQYRVEANQPHGVTILYKQGGLKKAIQNLKKGQDLVILADQKANPKEGIKCRFFGRETTTLPVVATVAKKYNYPIVPMFVIRKKNSARHDIVFMPELAYSKDDTVADIVQRQNDIIETVIRQHPDHWLWMHRKWKTEYPQIYNFDSRT